jgi:hypothetical protein
MKNSSFIEIKFGILISVFTLIWIVFEQLLGLQDEYVDWHKIVTNFSLIIPILGIWMAIGEYKAARVSKYNFQKGFGIGFRITLINTVLIIPIIYIFYLFINPDWTNTMMLKAKMDALNNGEDALKAMEEARSYFDFKYYTIRCVIETLIFGTLFSAIIAFIQKNRKTKNSWS